MALALLGSHIRPARPLGLRAASRAVVRPPFIAVWMLLAILAVAALAYWDEQRESKAALDDFTDEQVALADALAQSVRPTLAGSGGRAERLSAELRTSLHAAEREGLVRVLVAVPGAGEIVGSDGEVVSAPSIRRALEQGLRSLRLSRAEAAQLRLPARTAVAGLHRLELDDGRHSAVVVVATARAERDRELRAQWRLALSVGVTSGLVLAFGGFALRKQRTELELAHELAITNLRKERDERLVAADKLATMGALATGIAHEVSTPLGVILGRAEQLLPRQTDPRSRRAVEVIGEQTERIFAVIRGFLALARGGQAAMAESDAAAMARTATALVEHRFEKAGIRLVVQTAHDLPAVSCEPRLFEQVLINLLLNACDACTDSGTTVTLAVRRNGERVAFVVTDDGVGIRPEVAARATQPFFTTKAEGLGSGLGLAISNEIVKHHCGSLTIAARTDQRGTRACVELPSTTGEAHG